MLAAAAFFIPFVCVRAMDVKDDIRSASRLLKCESMFGKHGFRSEEAMSLRRKD